MQGGMQVGMQGHTQGGVQGGMQGQRHVRTKICKDRSTRRNVGLSRNGEVAHNFIGVDDEMRWFSATLRVSPSNFYGGSSFFSV